jgi:hypothetical protein
MKAVTVLAIVLAALTLGSACARSPTGLAEPPTNALRTAGDTSGIGLRPSVARRESDRPSNYAVAW